MPLVILKTIGQIFVFWSLFLYIFPQGILIAEEYISVEQFEFEYQIVVGWAVFGVFGALGLTSSMYFIAVGRGTPLPFDAPRYLVVRGPYRFVRNPMAIAGLSQAIGVGILYGSWMMMVYAFVGGVVWDLFVRPSEEADLAERFGDSYDHYQNKVGCWIPNPWPYHTVVEN